ncbi:MAG: 1,4-alpha-glucan branching protein GlgB, partial [Comamonadaceae bacterium]
VAASARSQLWHHRQFDNLGAHADGAGTRFGVWAPNARSVSVIGSFNDWNPEALTLESSGSGIWRGTHAHARAGDLYKYRVEDASGHLSDRADPYAFRAEALPGTASQVWDLGYAWGDSQWMASRSQRQGPAAAMSIYEVHLGSWQRQDDGRYLNYRDLAHRLAAHCTAMGFTHVELMPITEHPFYGSWGYQTTGYFSPTARYGNPQDLMALVDTLHQHGIGVLLDWVGSHFPADAHALAHFDGTALFEHEDPRKGFHPQWNSLIFNYGRYEVRDFLISSALFWLEKYHFDGLRVDAVSSMLYLDFAREPGEWEPNADGGHQNWEAVQFLRDLNGAVHSAFPDVHMIAEESTAWKSVSRPAAEGGLGFGMKWNMGWMNDTLRYVQRDPVHRQWHEGDIRFSGVYAFDENFVLALSHDEVVYGKRSLLTRQPGDEWQRFAGLRTLYGYMWSHPGKKLLFMGGEFGQVEEWHHEGTLEWHLWARARHSGLARWVADLNRAYRDLPALHAGDFDPAGFSWAPVAPHQPTVLAMLRNAGGESVLAVHNLTPSPVHALRIGVPRAGVWHEVLNSDAQTYGGSGVGNCGGATATNDGLADVPASLQITVPPLSSVFFSTRPLGA